MKPKNVLHLYLGAKVRVNDTYDTAIIGIHTNGNIQVAKAYGSQDYFNADQLKPILRKLQDMTEGDGKKIFGTKSRYMLYRKEREENNGDLWLFTPNETVKLLAAGFWLFNQSAFETGEVIDLKTLNA